MSNHSPKVQTTTTVTVPLAITIVVALLTLAAALFWVTVSLLERGDATGDLLYTIAGALAFLVMLIPAGFLFEIVYALIFERVSE